MAVSRADFPDHLGHEERGRRTPDVSAVGARLREGLGFVLLEGVCPWGQTAAGQLCGC